MQIFDVPGFGIHWNDKFFRLALKFLFLPEYFKESNNNFEQLCINYANEKIQAFCTQRLIDEEKDWYNKEGILVPDFSFISNDDIVGMSYNIISIM